MDIVIDTDPGVDDALALLLALNLPKLSIKAITATFGNVSVHQAVRNILSVLEIASPHYTPSVVQGAEHPLKKLFVKRDYRVHGRNGLGNVNLPVSHLKPTKKRLYDTLKIEKNTSYICLGPLTNFAQLILKNSSVIRRIRNIILMGGAVYAPGNVTKFAEFNIYSDPDAAKIVLNSGIPITMVGLDVTHKTLLTENDLKDLDISNPILNFIKKISSYYIKFHKEHRNMKGCFLHDPLAIAVAVDRNIVKTEKLPIDVVTEGKKVGQTFIKRGMKPNVDVCIEVDNEKFMRLFRKHLFQKEISYNKSS